MSKTILFTTNIKCGGCVSTLTPVLNKLAGENTWKVDTENPAKILSVTTQHLKTEDIIHAVQSAGFKIELLSQ